MEKFGVWYIPADDEQEKIVLCKTKERAQEIADKKRESMAEGDNMMLIRARCDDEGNIVSPQFEVFNTWTK